MKSLILAFCLAALSHIVRADDECYFNWPDHITAYHLLAQFDSSDREDYCRGVAEGYFVGIVHASGQYFDIPATVPLGVAVDLLTKFVREHPERGAWHAATAIRMALMEVYPVRQSEITDNKVIDIEELQRQLDEYERNPPHDPQEIQRLLRSYGYPVVEKPGEFDWERFLEEYEKYKAAREAEKKKKNPQR